MNKWTLGRPLSAVLVATAVLASAAGAQNASDLRAPMREVRGQAIISKELPAAELTFGEAFRYMGGQWVNLYGNAEAEQHLYVKGGTSGPVEQFYIVQFEHFLPTNNLTYDYSPDQTTDIGGLQFVYDVKSWPDYAAIQMEDADGAAFARLLAQHNLTFPKRTARVRMFHLPTRDRRTELMIIYGEALPEGSAVPVREGGVQLDKESPASAKVFLEHARRDLSIRKP